MISSFWYACLTSRHIQHSAKAPTEPLMQIKMNQLPTRASTMSLFAKSLRSTSISTDWIRPHSKQLSFAYHLPKTSKLSNSATTVWRTRNFQLWFTTCPRITAPSRTSSSTGIPSIPRSLRRATPCLQELTNSMKFNHQQRKISQKRWVCLQDWSPKERNYRLYSWEQADSKTSTCSTSCLLWNLTQTWPWTGTSKCSIFHTTTSAAQPYKSSKASSNRTVHLNSLVLPRTDLPQKIFYLY